jgi:GNAT superfamily N-acetyltransferase
MTVTLTPAEDADWPIAWAIQREAFLDLVTRSWGGWTEDQVRKCADAWNTKHTRLIRSESEVLGWVRLEHGPDHDWLDLVVIAPPHQGQGVGTKVMKQLIAEADARSVPLWLSVYKTNTARRLYQRLGLREMPRDDLRVYMVHPTFAASTPPR